MANTTYKVNGMKCDGCASSVREALEKADASAKVEIDLDAGEVSIQGELGADDVRAAVEGAGYEYAGPA